ncbi:Protein NRDE2 -like protein [Trametes pubescens]|uniref:Protein NRDE2-like protein n=1 Tax=Trametes pubescens TaxID=154538 RepID=A0A1M2V676_TRAPU|nr:Protein NRDE2 -like protein [Trametes pubescens]
MSAPSFSSFPAFNTFPDLDPGPSTRTSTSKEDNLKEDDKKRHKKSKRDDGGLEPDGDRKKKKHKHDKYRREDRAEVRDKHKRRSRSPARHKGYGGSDDERGKAEEDRMHSHDDSQVSGVKQGLVYFTDRRGDLLNMPELTDSSVRRMLASGPTHRLLASAENKFKYEEEDGFLRITTNRPRKDEQAYRDIELTKQRDPLDSDQSESSEESASSDDESDTTPMTSLQATLKGLEEKLAAKPDDIPAWLSLLAHTLTTVPSTTKNASKARAEITVSVLSRALAAHPSNARSKNLRLRYMKAGEELWQDGKLQAEWEEAVKVGDIEIWMAWLDWRVRTTNSILTSMVDDSARVMRALASTQDEVGQLRVFWRVAVALRDAGYVERANALFQAQAELLYHTPSAVSGRAFEEQLNSLEEFWDSEVPRAGEPGATGWAAWEASNRADQPPPPSSKLPNLDPRISDPYSRWAASEALADRIRALSLRSTDDDDDDSEDPYAVVLFSDIRPFLASVRSERAKDVFRRVWLAFAGLHVPGFLASLSEHPADNADDHWAYAHLATSSYISSVFPADTSAKRITADAHAGVLVGREREYGSGFGPVKSWGYGTIEPLDNLGQGRWTMWTSEDVQGIDTSLVREIFKQCRIAGDTTEWDILNLTFEAAVDIKGALKVSKALLAGARDSLPHWAAHARLECLRGRHVDARKVYQTILTTSSEHRPGEGALWWDWAQMEWLSRNDDAALTVILRSSGVAGTGGIAVLRAKRHFESLLMTELLRAHWKERAPWIKIAVLLELLTSTAQSAMTLLDFYLNALEEGSAAHESLTVASLALLYNHSLVLKNPSPPALLRSRAERAIEEYPGNTAVLGIFLEAEKGQGIWGRVRATLGETAADGTGKEKDLARRVAEVWVAGWEKGRWEAEVERTRGGLSAAAEDERTRGSAILWKLFVAFELRAGQPERAKKVLFRAVGECPLVKELYLLAFGPLRAVFSARELDGWVDTMAERGVRMRVGLDEAVGEWRENGGDARRMKEEGGEDEDDEIESSARELRRLMPY